MKPQNAYLNIPNPVIINCGEGFILSRTGDVYMDQEGLYWWIPSVNDCLMHAKLVNGDTIILDTSFFSLRGLSPEKIKFYPRGGNEYPNVKSFRGIYLIFDKDYEHLNLSNQFKIISYKILVKNKEGEILGHFHFKDNPDNLDYYSSMHYLIKNEPSSYVVEIYNVEISCPCWDEYGILLDSLSVYIGK